MGNFVKASVPTPKPRSKGITSGKSIFTRIENIAQSPKACRVTVSLKPLSRTLIPNKTIIGKVPASKLSKLFNVKIETPDTKLKIINTPIIVVKIKEDAIFTPP